jgi:hypothetical protein
MRRSKRSQRGLSLIETTVTLGVLATAAGALAMAVLSSQKAADSMRARDVVRAQSIKYMERLTRLTFGEAADPPASAAQIEELFDDNAVVSGGSVMTLHSLRTPVNDHGWRFRIQGFEVDGVFEIEINSDLDGNGTHSGIRGPNEPTMSGTWTAGDGVTVVPLLGEGRPELLRVEIFFNGEPVLRTLRAAPPENS